MEPASGSSQGTGGEKAAGSDGRAAPGKLAKQAFQDVDDDLMFKAPAAKRKEPVRLAAPIPKVC